MDDAAIGPLLDDLNQGDPQRRAAAAEKLAQCDPPPTKAAVSLVRACASADDPVREWVVAALENLGPPPANALAALATLTGDASDDVAFWAVTLLGRAKSAASEIVGVLTGVLSSQRSAEVRRRAAWALGQLGPSPAAIAALSAAATDADRRVARAAQQAMAAIAEDSGTRS